MATKKHARSRNCCTKEAAVGERRAHIRNKRRRIYRERIVEAAERVFERRGLDGTTMAEVARAAGVATGTLYNCFSGKKEVLGVLLEHVGKEHLSRLNRIVAETTDPADRVQRLIHGCFESVRLRSSTFTAFVKHGANCESRSGRVEDDTSAGWYYGMTLRLFEDALRDAAQVGAIRNDISPNELTAFLTGAMTVVARNWLQKGRREDLRQRAQLVTDLFLWGAGS